MSTVQSLNVRSSTLRIIQNLLFRRMKPFRLTASNFGLISAVIEINSFNRYTYKRLLGEYSTDDRNKVSESLCLCEISSFVILLFQ